MSIHSILVIIICFLAIISLYFLTVSVMAKGHANRYRSKTRIIAGEEIKIGQAVYINPKDGKAYRGCCQAIGVATRDICAGEKID
jgi:hypothetical protein